MREPNAVVKAGVTLHRNAIRYVCHLNEAQVEEETVTSQLSAPAASRRPMRLLIDTVLRGTAFALFWAVLNRGASDSWILGAPLVVVATTLSLLIVPAAQHRIAPLGVLRYVVYFLQQTFLSSVDVALRVFKPSMPIHPGMIRYKTQLPADNMRVIMANTCSLLPGTLSVGIEGDVLVVHALDTTMAVMDDLRTLERMVGGIYGLELSQEAT
ncbi:MAG: Na+/H+ antiporter subunit E [Anaerolineae bacterium]